MSETASQYLQRIGRKGGKKSRRVLSESCAKNMVRVREAKRAYRRFHASCFWSYDQHYRITLDDLPWVAKQLRTFGGREGWELANKLCP